MGDRSFSSLVVDDGGTGVVVLVVAARQSVETLVVVW